MSNDTSVSALARGPATAPTPARPGQKTATAAHERLDVRCERPAQTLLRARKRRPPSRRELERLLNRHRRAMARAACAASAPQTTPVSPA